MMETKEGFLAALGMPITWYVSESGETAPHEIRSTLSAISAASGFHGPNVANLRGGGYSDR
ncbi:MAG: hypothetical protein ACRD4Y_10425 [Candidatus Acidiferrales bacterium]